MALISFSFAYCSRISKILVPICLYCFNCTKFGQLILRKIIKIIATNLTIGNNFNYFPENQLTKFRAV